MNVSLFAPSRCARIPHSTGSQVSTLAGLRRRIGSLAHVRGAALIQVVLTVVCLLPTDSLAQNIISTIAGGGLPSTTATTVDLPGPTSAIRDSAGNTYIAAPYSTYVFKLFGANVSVYAGTGIEGYGGDGGPAGGAILGLPNGLTIDSAGNIYIADFKTSRIRMVTTPGGIISTVAGNGKKCEPSTAACGDGGPASSASFNFPMSVAVDSAGNLYIADAFDNRIRAVNRGTKTTKIFGVSIAKGAIATIAGNGVPCANPTSKCGDGSALGPYLNYPQNLAFDTAGNLYIADTRDNKIRELSVSTNKLSTVAGTGNACLPGPVCGVGDNGPPTSAALHMPMWIFLDPSNNIYIADTYHHRIRFVNTNVTPQVITTVAGNGQPCNPTANPGCGDGGPATGAELNYPASVFLDNGGNMIIADSGDQSVRQVTAGNISTIAGGGNGNDGMAATSAFLAGPSDVAEDSAGNIYIADTANNRIRKVDTSGKISTVVGIGIAGSTGDGGPATSATLNGPTGVKVDSSGNIWIADAGNNTVRRVDGTTQIITTYAGNPGAACFPTTDPCGDGQSATGPQAAISTPRAIALDASGNLYIADYTGYKVRIVDATMQNINTFAGTGQKGHIGTNVPPTQAKLDHPSGVAVDSLGNVYIDDSYNNVIRYVSGGLINPYALSGAAHLQGDGGPALDGGMWNPLEIAMDPSNNLFISGGNNNVVQRVDAITATYTIGTVAGDYAQPIEGGFGGDGGPATAAKLANLGVFVDGNQNLYIADAGNNRIRTVHLTPGITVKDTLTNFGAWPIGMPGTPQSFTISGSGGVDLTLNSLSFTGADPQDFSQTSTCGSTPALIGVDVVCTITVTFTPQYYGQRTATLQLSDNDPSGTQNVALAGFGPYFTVSAAPPSITIPQGTTGNVTLTVAPFGQFTGTVNLAASGLPPATMHSITPGSVTLDGSNSANATLAISPSTKTPVGTYNVVATGRFASDSSVQWSVKIPVTVSSSSH